MSEPDLGGDLWIFAWTEEVKFKQTILVWCAFGAHNKDPTWSIYIIINWLCHLDLLHHIWSGNGVLYIDTR